MIAAWVVLSSVAWMPEADSGIRCPIFFCGENGTRETGLVRPVAGPVVAVTLPPVTFRPPDCPDWGCGSNGPLEDGLARPAGEPATVTLPAFRPPDCPKDECGMNGTAETGLLRAVGPVLGATVR